MSKDGWLPPGVEYHMIPGMVDDDIDEAEWVDDQVNWDEVYDDDGMRVHKHRGDLKNEPAPFFDHVCMEEVDGEMLYPEARQGGIGVPDCGYCDWEDRQVDKLRAGVTP